MGKDVLGKEVFISLIDNYRVIEFYIKVTGVSKNNNISLLDDNMHGYISYNKIEDIYKENNLVLKPNNISIKIDNKNNKDKVKRRLRKMKLKVTNNDDLFKELSSYLDIATFVLSMFSSLSLVVSTIMISIIINITVLERTKEIGILRSVGYTRKNIKYIFNTEGIILGVMVGLFSSVISSFLINIISDIIKDKFDISISLNPNKYYILGIFISVFVTLLSSYFPSKKASKFDPVKSLKYE
jgi:ABC-type antimicrobial peptide transport system permease subunit